MRIICPNCQARYDIPDTAIPSSGREVQCAVCTRAWYQLPLAQNAAATAQARSAQTAPPRPAPAMAGAPDAPAPDKPARPAAPPPRPAGPAQATPPPDLDDLPRRELDPAVVAILREEADREAQARARRTAPEPVVPPAPRPMPAAEKGEGARARLARLQAAEKAASAPKMMPDTEALVEDPHAASREARPPVLKDLPAPLPPALLRTTTGRGRRDLPVKLSPSEVAEAEERRQRVGFRLGFGLTAGLCCAVLALYLAAPYAAHALPAGTPFAEAVIAHGDRVQAQLVDALNRWLAPL